MIDFLKEYWPVILLVIGIICSVCAYIASKFSSSRKDEDSILEPVKPRTQVPGISRRTQDELLQRRYTLEQDIMQLVNGGAGMQALRKKIQEDPEKNRATYGLAYMDKRAKLERLFCEYQVLMKEAETLPKGKDSQLRPMRDEALYRELVEFRPM